MWKLLLCMQVHWVLWCHVSAHGYCIVGAVTSWSACNGEAFRSREELSTINHCSSWRSWWLHWSIFRRSSTLICWKPSLKHDRGSAPPGDIYELETTRNHSFIALCHEWGYYWFFLLAMSIECQPISWLGVLVASGNVIQAQDADSV